MFGAICDNFTKSTGTESLVPIETVIHSNNIELFQVVIRRRERHYMWHKYSHTPYDFLVKNILISNKKKMKVKKKTSGFCTWSRELDIRLSGKVGQAIMADLGDKTLSSRDKVKVQANLGEIEMEKINPDKVYRKLKGRKINFNHPWVQQIRQDEKNVVCVVHAITKLVADAEIKMTSVIKSGPGVQSGGEGEDKSKDLGLIKGTPVAYKVIELQIGKQSGTIVPCMGVGFKGGFLDEKKIIGMPSGDVTVESSESESEDEEDQTTSEPVPDESPAPTEEATQEETAPTEEAAPETSGDGEGTSPDNVATILKPVIDLPESERDSLTAVLKSILPEDIEKLDKIFVESSSSQDEGEKVSNTGDSEFMDRESCLKILTMAGYTEKSDIELAITDTSSAIFKACGHLIGAMTHLSMELLELVRACLPEIAEDLLQLFGQALKGEKTATLDDAKLANSNVGRDLLDKMTIQVDSGSATIPEVLPDHLDKVYWVLYALYGVA